MVLPSFDQMGVMKRQRKKSEFARHKNTVSTKSKQKKEGSEERRSINWEKLREWIIWRSLWGPGAHLLEADWYKRGVTGLMDAVPELTEAGYPWGSWLENCPSPLEHDAGPRRLGLQRLHPQDRDPMVQADLLPRWQWPTSSAVYDQIYGVNYFTFTPNLSLLIWKSGLAMQSVYGWEDRVNLGV